MISSSLPDIFERANTTCIRVQKQGGPFSLHLSSYSTEKHMPSKAGYAPGQHHYLSLNNNRPRSISTQSIKIKSILHKQNSKRGEQSKSRIKVDFKDFDFLQNSFNKPKVGMSVVNYSNFPYESSRRSNNNIVDLEEAESIKNKLQNSISQVSLLFKNLEESYSIISETKIQLNWLNNATFNNLQDFQSDFQAALSKCYSNLSVMRRDTSSELKDNKQYLDKLKGELHICSSFAKDLNRKSEDLYQECLTANTTTTPRGSATPHSQLADFQEISTIRKSSRGATGDQSRRNKIFELQKKGESPDLPFSTERENKFMLNGKQIDILNFENEV